MEETRKQVVTRVEARNIEDKQDSLVVEEEITLTLDGETLLHATCTPSHLEALVYGHLVSEGWIRSLQDVVSVASRQNDFVAELRDGVPSPLIPEELRPLKTPFTVSTDRLLAAAKECLNRGIIFRETGGTHAAALWNRSGMIGFFEDISRNCALEKVLGDAFLRGVDFDETFVFLSSRVPRRMLLKLARCGIPIVGAVSAPTFDAVEEAKRLGLCICGFVRGEGMNVYSSQWRVGL